jgi:hypothetical protein
MQTIGAINIFPVFVVFIHIQNYIFQSGFKAPIQQGRKLKNAALEKCNASTAGLFDPQKYLRIGAEGIVSSFIVDASGLW